MEDLYFSFFLNMHLVDKMTVFEVLSTFFYINTLLLLVMVPIPIVRKVLMYGAKVKAQFSHRRRQLRSVTNIPAVPIQLC